MRAQTHGTREIRKVVITRSREGNAKLAERLREGGFEPVSLDTLEFLPPEDWSGADSAISRLGGFDWILFTSPTGAEFFARRMRALSLPCPWRGKPSVAAVGEMTSAALQKEGVDVEFVPSTYLTEALAEELPNGRGGAVLMLRANIGDPTVVATLERKGFKVTDIAIYRTSPLAGRGDSAEETSRGADAVIFASPSAVEAFMNRSRSTGEASELTSLLAVCIGPVTASAARERGFQQILIAKTHTLEGVLESLKDASAGRRGGEC